MSSGLTKAPFGLLPRAHIILLREYGGEGVTRRTGMSSSRIDAASKALSDVTDVAAAPGKWDMSMTLSSLGHSSQFRSAGPALFCISFGPPFDFTGFQWFLLGLLRLIQFHSVVLALFTESKQTPTPFSSAGRSVLVDFLF